ncbi:MAG: hypothetical protein O3C65_10110 [Proteobacteria bacterium]|nr:hypothetical protein [Pseudomonadota bacterium]MDA1059029.1 hypothetical protein [Pseudomonadota bacterium]
MAILASRRICRRLLILLPFVVAACGTANDGLLSRQFSWSDYVAGNDIRQSCPATTLDRYRLIFNAEYTKQVRTYDILQRREGATLHGRVFRGSLLADQSFPSALAGLLGRSGSADLNAENLEEFRRSLVDASSAFTEMPNYLRSDSYFWVVLQCASGVMTTWVFTGPADRLERLPFRRFLLSHDPTGIAVRVQRPVGADRTTDFGRLYSQIGSETTERAFGQGGALFQFKYEDGQISLFGG